MPAARCALWRRCRRSRRSSATGRLELGLPACAVGHEYTWEPVPDGCRAGPGRLDLRHRSCRRPGDPGRGRARVGGEGEPPHRQGRRRWRPDCSRATDIAVSPRGDIYVAELHRTVASRSSRRARPHRSCSVRPCCRRRSNGRRAASTRRSTPCRRSATTLRRRRPPPRATWCCSGSETAVPRRRLGGERCRACPAVCASDASLIG